MKQTRQYRCLSGEIIELTKLQAGSIWRILHARELDVRCWYYIDNSVSIGSFNDAVKHPKSAWASTDGCDIFREGPEGYILGIVALTDLATGKIIYETAVPI